MKITQIFLRNWRCFSSAACPIGSKLIITGPCGSGKTSFLDAFCFLRDLARGVNLVSAVDRRGGLSHLRNLQARYPETDIVLMLYLRDNQKKEWIYRLRLGEDGSAPFIKEELIWYASALLLRRPDREDKKRAIRRQESCLSPRLVTPSIEVLARFLRSLHYENPQPESIRNQNLMMAMSSDFQEDDLLVRIIRTPERLRKLRLRRLSEVMKTLIEGFGQLRLDRDYLGRWQLSASCEHWRPRVSWRDWTEWPEAGLRLFSIFWTILERDTPLLIEEPETGLHPEAVIQMPRIIRELVRSSHRPPQLIITTHEPYFLKDRLIRPEEIVLLIPDKSGTKMATGWPKNLISSFLEDRAAVAGEVKARMQAEKQPWLPLFSSQPGGKNDSVDRKKDKFYHLSRKSNSGAIND